MKRQIAALLATDHDEITLRHMNVQMQSGTYYCGLFAIAFATALIHGEHPGKFLFNQDSMRQHLMKCLELGEMTMFPIKKTRRSARQMKSEDVIEILCSCRMPEITGVDMIECIVHAVDGIIFPCVCLCHRKLAKKEVSGIVLVVTNYTHAVVTCPWITHAHCELGIISRSGLCPWVYSMMRQKIQN